MNKIKKIVAACMALVMAFTMTASAGLFSSKDDDTTDETSPENLIATGEFLYPITNGVFRINVYSTYCEISQYLSTRGSVVIPSKIQNLPVLNICAEAFKDQTTIKSITISDSVYSIGESAFEGCINLESVKLPSSLSQMGSSAFQNCTSLKTVDIPNTLELIPSNAFYGCTSMTSAIIEEPEVLSVDEDGNEVKTPSRILDEGAFSNDTSLCYLYIGEDVAFGDNSDSKSDPLNGSTEFLTVYGYSGSDGAKYCADNFVDFKLVTNKSQALAEFKSAAATASLTKSYGISEKFEGEDLQITVEAAYIVKSALNYSVTTTKEKEVITKDYSYTPQTNSVVAIIGVSVKNNTSSDIKLSFIDAGVQIDGITGRLADFSTLNLSQASKYSAPSYTEIEPNETQDIYFASVIDNDWNEISLTLSGYAELGNVCFVIKSTDDEVSYIGSAENAIEAEATTEPVSEPASETAEDETTTAVTGESSTLAETTVADTTATTGESTSAAG